MDRRNQWWVVSLLLAWSLCLSAARAVDVDSQIRMLKDTNTFARRVAARRMYELADPRTVEPLAVALQDSDWQVRQRAAKALGTIRDPRAVEPLIEALKDSVQSVRGWAAWALGEIKDPRAIEPLAKALESGDALEELEATRALSNMGTLATPALVTALQSKHFSSPDNAANALGRIKDDRAVDALVAHLKAYNSYARPASANALMQIGMAKLTVDRLIPALNGGDSAVSEAAHALGRFDDPSAIKSLSAALQAHQDSKSIVSGMARDALVAIGPPAVEPLIVALKDGDVSVRSQVMVALGRIKDPRAVAALTATLRDANRDLRRSAAWALGEIKDPRAVEPLIVALKDGDASVRAQVAQALGAIKDMRALEPLVAKLKNDDPAVRGIASLALGEIKDPRAVEPLISALKDNDVEVRAMAAASLGKIQDARALDALATSLKEEQLDVRRSVLAFLDHFGDKAEMTALAAALPDWDFRALIGEELFRLGWHPETDQGKVYLWICQEDVAELKKNWEQTQRILLQDVPSRDKKKIDNAVFALINLGHEEVIPKLLEILDAQGHKEMAETYLNSGQKQLGDAASAWATRHGYTIQKGFGSHEASWNKWR